MFGPQLCFKKFNAAFHLVGDSTIQQQPSGDFSLMYVLSALLCSAGTWVWSCSGSTSSAT